MRSLGPDAAARTLACGVALLFAAPLLAWFDAPVHRPQDEGMLLVYPELLLRGLLPHRDFLATYPPGNFYLLALVYQLFEPSIAIERAVGFSYRIALILGIVALGFRRGPTIGAVCGIATALILQPLRLEAFSWVAGLALLVWAAVALQTQRQLLAGALMGLALWFRLDLVLAIGLVAASTLWVPRDDRGAELQKLGLGLIAALLPLAIYFVGVSLHQAIDDLVVGPILRTGPARRLPLSSLGTNGVRLLLLLGIGVVASVLAAWQARKLSTRDRINPIIIAGLSIGLLPQAAQRLDSDHLVYACAAVGGLLPLAVDQLLVSRLARVSRLIVTIAIILTTAGTPAAQLAVKSVAHVLSSPPTAWIHRNDRKLPARGLHELMAFQKLGSILDLQAVPGERLFIGPSDLSRTNYSDLHLYFLFPELIPASYFLELNPNSANRLGTRLTQDLQQAHWLLLSEEWDRWDEANSSTQHGDSRPNQVVRKHFVQAAQHGVWELLRRREPR